MTDRRANDGFSLLEVLVALAILSGVLAVTYPMLSGQAVFARTSEARTMARLHLRSTMDQLGITIPLTLGEQKGMLDDNYSWSVEIAPYSAAGALPEFDLRAVNVTLRWGGKRSLSASPLLKNMDGVDRATDKVSVS